MTKLTRTWAILTVFLAVFAVMATNPVAPHGLVLQAALAADEEQVFPDFGQVRSRYNQVFGMNFPLGAPIDGSLGIGSEVRINGTYLASIYCKTYDKSPEGPVFSFDVTTILDSSLEEKKQWLSKQSETGQLDFTKHRTALTFSNNMIRSIWPEITRTQANEIILGAIKAYVNNDFASRDFAYLDKLQKEGDLGSISDYPTYKGFEFYYDVGNNWLTLLIRRPSLVPPVLDELSTSSAQQSTPASGAIDFSAYSYQGLLKLHQDLTREIMGRSEWKEVTVPPGQWEVGLDIPAGNYAVTIHESSCNFTVWGSEYQNYSADGGLLVNQALYEKGSGFGSDRIGKVTLENGNIVGIIGAPVVFSPVLGLGF